MFCLHGSLKVISLFAHSRGGEGGCSLLGCGSPPPSRWAGGCRAPAIILRIAEGEPGVRILGGGPGLMFQGLYTVTRQKKLTSLNCDRWLVWISLSLMSERAVLQCPAAPLRVCGCQCSRLDLGWALRKHHRAVRSSHEAQFELFLEELLC